MRALLLSVAGLVLLASPVVAADPPKPLVSKVFSVADLVTPIPGLESSQPIPSVPAQKTTAENAEHLLKLVKNVVRPNSWDVAAGAGKIEFSAIGCALVVTNTAEVIAEVADLLAALRRLQDICVGTEVRILKVPTGFCEKMNLKRDGTTCLTARELAAVLETAQGHRDTNVMQFPKLTTFDGQNVTVRIGDTRMFTTGIEAKRKGDKFVVVPTTTAVELGHTLTLCGRVSADSKFVNLTMNVTHTRQVGHAPRVELNGFTTLHLEGGSNAQPAPLAERFEIPVLKTEKVEKSAVVPTGGTIVLGGWNERTEGKVMQVGAGLAQRRLKIIPPAECEVLVLATTRVIRTESPAMEVAPMPREVPPAGEKVLAYCLKHVTAADAVQAIHTFLDGKNLNARMTFDAASNCVFVVAEQGLRQEIVKLLDALDKKSEMVRIEAMVVQVPRGFCKNSGLEGNAPVWTLTAREAAMFTALLRAQKQTGTMDVLARPVIQVCNGQTGTIQVGQSVPAPQGVTPAGGVAGESMPVGVSAMFIPRLTPDGECVKLKATMKVTAMGAPIKLTVAEQVPGQPLPVARVIEKPTFNVQTFECVARIPLGSTAVYAMPARGSGDEGMETLVIVKPMLAK
ncbi:MAG: hypothetical protein L0241_06510 [Planctomycetia bacterium]|nr:hypothetical protein [Planctomycetia bacterium]